MKLFFFLTLFLTALGTSFVPTIGLALNLNLDYPAFGGLDLNTDQNPNSLIAWIYYFIVGIGGLAAFVMLVWGGVQWLTSGAIPSQAGEARDRIKNAILGLLLILASFLIIQIINPGLTILQVPGFPLAVGQIPTLPVPPGSGTGGTACTASAGDVTVTVDGQPSIQFPHPGPTSATLAWSTTTTCLACVATADPIPFDGPTAALWNNPNISPNGSASINLSSVPNPLPNGTLINFNLACGSVIGTASVRVTSTAGGTPPIITQFQVTDQNNQTTWLPGGPPTSAPTYTCCGAGTQIPTSHDLRFRWNSTNASECAGEDALSGNLGPGGPISSPGLIALNPCSVLNATCTFTLRCIGTALPDALSTIKIHRTQ